MISLETYLDQYDCFTQTGIIPIDQLRLRLHQELYRARAIFHTDLVLSPNVPEPKRIEDFLSLPDSKDHNNDAAIQECKRDQLNQLFSRLNIESQNMLL